MISPFPFQKGEDEGEGSVSRAPINTGLQAGDSPREMKMSRFNGLASRPSAIKHRGLRCRHEKAVETA
jgi:hypothetical protein